MRVIYLIHIILRKIIKYAHERCKIESRNSRRIFVCKCVQTFGKRDFRFCDLEFAYDQRTGYNVRIIKERRKQLPAYNQKKQKGVYLRIT